MRSAAFCGLGNRVSSGRSKRREVRLLQLAALSTEKLEVFSDCNISPSGRAAALVSAAARTLKLLSEPSNHHACLKSLSIVNGNAAALRGVQATRTVWALDRHHQAQQP